MTPNPPPAAQVESAEATQGRPTMKLGDANVPDCTNDNCPLSAGAMPENCPEENCPFLLMPYSEPIAKTAPQTIPEREGWGVREATPGGVWWVRMLPPPRPVHASLLMYWSEKCNDPYTASLLQAAAMTIMKMTERLAEYAELQDAEIVLLREEAKMARSALKEAREMLLAVTLLGAPGPAPKGSVKTVEVSVVLIAQAREFCAAVDERGNIIDHKDSR